MNNCPQAVRFCSERFVPEKAANKRRNFLFPGIKVNQTVTSMAQLRMVEVIITREEGWVVELVLYHKECSPSTAKRKYAAACPSPRFPTVSAIRQRASQAANI